MRGGGDVGAAAAGRRRQGVGRREPRRAGCCGRAGGPFGESDVERDPGGGFASLSFWSRRAEDAALAGRGPDPAERLGSGARREQPAAARPAAGVSLPDGRRRAGGIAFATRPPALRPPPPPPRRYVRRASRWRLVSHGTRKEERGRPLREGRAAGHRVCPPAAVAGRGHPRGERRPWAGPAFGLASVCCGGMEEEPGFEVGSPGTGGGDDASLLPPSRGQVAGSEVLETEGNRGAAPAGRRPAGSPEERRRAR